MTDLLIDGLIAVGVGAVVSMCVLNILVDFGYVKLIYKRQIIKNNKPNPTSDNHSEAS